MSTTIKEKSEKMSFYELNILDIYPLIDNFFFIYLFLKKYLVQPNFFL